MTITSGTAIAGGDGRNRDFDDGERKQFGALETDPLP
jgi:hypothetical protein